jgi:amidohydrolase
MIIFLQGAVMDYKEKLAAFIDGADADYKAIALDIHARPETSNHEHFACKRLSDKLEAEGFSVKVDVAGHPTGFTAVYKPKDGAAPVIAFLAEYDALAGIGHACGHNLYGATSGLAGAALRTLADELGFEVRVYGTPGEEGGENGMAKASFVREGFFDDVDAALCSHPGIQYSRLTETSLACAPAEIEFWGKASHAAARPEEGINALDAVIQVYNSINALRQHLSSDVRIHGIITHGGDAPNIVPDYAQARFYFRATTKKTLEAVCEKARRIVEGAALATGARGSIQFARNVVDDTIPTPLFDEVYKKNFEALGGTILPARSGNYSSGSSDVGNVSQVIPVIQPMLCITDQKISGHSVEMREAACSEQGLSTISFGAKALSFTALDLILDKSLLARVKGEHRGLVSGLG